MVSFYKKFFDASSPDRARLAVHLHARKVGELDQNIIDLLKKFDLNDVPTQERQSLELLEAYLKSQGSVSAEQIKSIVDQATEFGLKHMASENGDNSAELCHKVVDSAELIEDVRQYKASLLVSSGPHPVTDLADFAETDAKL